MPKFKDKLFKRFKDYCDSPLNETDMRLRVETSEDNCNVIDIYDSEGRISIRKYSSDKFGMGAAFFSRPSSGFSITESEYTKLKELYLCKYKPKS